MRKKIEMEGRKFNEFTVLSFHSINKHRVSLWNCVCSCGNKRVIAGGHLRAGNRISCGCKGNLLLIESRTKHGRSHDPLYKSWSSMMTRCSNKARGISRKNYYDRGIRVCKRWHKLENFIADMGERPKGKTLDRIDNDKGYYKENCRWATPKQQANNRSNTRIFQYKGVEYTTSQLAEKFNFNHQMFASRIHRGWPIDKAVETPVRGK